MRKKPIIGTIVGVFDGALDGVQARLIRRTRLGYTVELLESQGEFRTGDQVHLSVAEFHIHKGEEGVYKKYGFPCQTLSNPDYSST